MINHGFELWQKAKSIIPGGNQLLSKRSEMFLPGGWPSYYKRAKGCEIWDMDDQHYFDLSIMGIGSCVLGYANEKVNHAVIRAVNDGSMSTLNCHEEVELAEKLTALHPWSGQVRFARTGGEACAIAVRIGRAASGRDNVAFCGYHGWHDWYLSANLADSKNLDGQLLPGLDPAGVPRALKGTSLPFSYGDIEQFDQIIKAHDIGVIVTEVERHKGLDLGFLRHLRAAADRTGAVLIFDEVSSGFRLCPGGMHMLHDVYPDIVILGKALGNGYPIGAIVGRKAVMDAAQKTFISSTYWTERIGFVAGLETLRQYQEEKAAEIAVNNGTYVTKCMKKLIEKYNFNIEIVGLATIPVLVIKEGPAGVFKTFFTQEMLKKGFLASNVTYVSIAHTRDIVDRYIAASDEVFAQAGEGMQKGCLETMLEGPVCHSGFRRLT